MTKTMLTLLILSAIFLTTACPSPPGIEKAKAASAKLAGYADSAVNVTRSLYRQKVITLEQKDKIADALIKLSDAGIRFDAAVRELENLYQDAHPPRDKLTELAALFNSGIVTQFLEILTTLKVISGDGAFLQAIELLRTTILTIAAAFSIKSETAAKFAEVSG